MKNTANAPEQTNMKELGITDFLCSRLLERKIQKPAEIQSRVIPRLLKGEDLLFRSPTGSGKTFAYLLPLFQRLFAPPEIPADETPAGETPMPEAPPAKTSGRISILVCAPTHELCSQIKGEADFLLKGWPAKNPRAALRSALIIGSANIDRQIEMLKKDNPQVIVGNPGRLLQLVRMRRLKLGGVKALVLDEGDRLVADEMLEETEALLGFMLAKDRQTIACSATVSVKSKERLLSFLKPQAGIEEAEGIPGSIEHWAFFAENRKKISTLRSFLAAAKPKKALVFTARGNDAGNILSQLQHHHFAAAGIWSGMDKKVRKTSMENFLRGSVSILVASDLACRGLDIEGLTHVIALDVPDNPELYLHRSGRTGRTGRRGIMANIGNEHDLRSLQRIEKKLGIVVYPKELYGGRVMSIEYDQEESDSVLP